MCRLEARQVGPDRSDLNVRIESNLRESRDHTNALVVCLEGVGQWLVGACGAPAARTDNIDLLASGAHMWLQCYVDSMHRHQQLLSLWTGRHALGCGTGEIDSNIALWEHLASEGISHCLITDDAEVASLAERAACRNVVLVEPPGTLDRPAEDAGQCACMGLFLAGAEAVQAGRHRVVYVHSSGLRLPWDAPPEMRAVMTDPDDPPPPGGTSPPGDVGEYQPRWAGNLTGQSTLDPDLILGWNQVAAAQVAVLDQGIGLLRAAVAQTADSKWCWLIHSLGQLPLGEHGRLGIQPELPYSEHLRALAILRPADALPCPRFHWGMRQLPHLHSWLLEQLQVLPAVPPDGQGMGICPQDDWLAVVRGRGGTGDFLWARTPAWSIRARGESTELYVQPDDRWEVCDVASLQPEVVELLRTAVVQFERNLAEGKPRMDAPPEILVNAMR